jgi:hypothetical protein
LKHFSRGFDGDLPQQFEQVVFLGGADGQAGMGCEDQLLKAGSVGHGSSSFENYRTLIKSGPGKDR